MFLIKSCLKKWNFGRQPSKFQVGRWHQIFRNNFEVSLSSPTNVRKQVNSNSCHFTNIPGGWPGGWSGVGRVGGRMGGWPSGWVAGWLEELKLRLTQFNFNWNCLLELSLAKTCFLMIWLKDYLNLKKNNNMN